MNSLENPLKSLKEGHWFKLICGASFQDLTAIRSLAIAYSLGGADCIDLAADPAVIKVVKDGLEVAKKLSQTTKIKGFSKYNQPWLMISLNDGEDPHFRKAQFDPLFCPQDCPRPCEKICPAQAIQFNFQSQGVIDEKCYGCGRCVPICPLNLIETRSYVSTIQGILPLINELNIEAIEIHTQVGHRQDFQRLWEGLKPIIPQLKLLAISCQDHEKVIDYLEDLYKIITPLNCPLIIQTDGRPMSGDIGAGTTHPAIKMAEKLIRQKMPVFLQLAGGTNQYTVKKLQEKKLIKTQENQDNSSYIAGVAYGSYARSILSPILQKLEEQNHTIYLEENPDLLWQSVTIASQLVNQIKTSNNPSLTIDN